MMSDKQKKLFLLLLPAAIILFGVFLWFEFGEGDSKTKKTTNLKIDIPDLPNNEKRQEKEEIFEAYERKELDFSQERKNIKSDKEDFFGLAGKKSYNDIEELYNKESSPGSVDQQKGGQVVSNEQRKKSVTEPEQSGDMSKLEKRNKQVKESAGLEEDDNKKMQNITETTETTKDFQSADGFGIAYGDSFRKENKSEASSNVDLNDFAQAELISDRSIKDNSELVFILNENFITDQYTINKMARLYCTADIVDNRIDIICNTIRNTDGKVYNTTLSGYNENYQRGIMVEGKIDRVVNKANNEALEEGAEVLSELTGFGNSISDVVRSGANALENDTEVLLKEGYIMLFKDETN